MPFALLGRLSRRTDCQSVRAGQDRLTIRTTGSARRALCFALALFAGLSWSPPAQACNVPVFRYALERWAPDAYEIVVFHDGTLGPEEKRLLDSLQDYVDKREACPSNITLAVVDTRRKMDEELARVLHAQAGASLPWMVVRYPRIANIKANVYAGPWNGARLKKLLDSPMRRILAERLLRSQTAVWIMIESGNKQKDDETAQWLQDHLAKLEKTLKLPELTSAPKDKLRIDVALKIEFSLLRLSRHDNEETELVRMLLGMEDDLEDRKEPIVYPVFGRGLALWAIVGKGITQDNIDRAAKFLVGPCSCEIKAQNPGVDLLLTADWEERLRGRVTTTPEPPPLASLFPESARVSEKGAWPGLRYSEAPDVSKPSGAAGASEYLSPGHPSVLWRNVLLALGGGLILLIVASMRVYARKQ
jgi:hypothetical protein